MKKLVSMFLFALMLVGCIFGLSSCGTITPNSNPDAAVIALEEANYEDVVKHSGGAYSFLEVEDLEYCVSGIRVEGKCEWIDIFYFKNAKAADAAWKKLQEEAESWFVNANPNDYGSSFICKKSGNMIWYGTKNAAKDAA